MSHKLPAIEILSAKDIAFHFDFDKNLLQSKLRMEMRRNLYLIFKEAVNNVAKYSQAANAFVMIWNKENNLKMTIRDDGSGFEISTIKSGNGLLNMQQRARTQVSLNHHVCHQGGVMMISTSVLVSFHTPSLLLALILKVYLPASRLV